MGLYWTIFTPWDRMRPYIDRSASFRRWSSVFKWVSQQRCLCACSTVLFKIFTCWVINIYGPANGGNGSNGGIYTPIHLRSWLSRTFLYLLSYKMFQLSLQLVYGLHLGKILALPGPQKKDAFVVFFYLNIFRFLSVFSDGVKRKRGNKLTAITTNLF